MNKEWEMVREFQIKANQPASSKPIKMDVSRSKIRYKWMLEELNEFLDAKDIVEQADAMIDLMYFAIGTLVEMGVRPDDLFEVVHKANLSKISANSDRIYDPDGKLMKPSGWIDPHKKIGKLISLQYSNAFE